MDTFTRVIVIYNPNSTGDSQKNAELFASQLSKKQPEIDVSTVATKYAGHAEEIAAAHASEKTTLIVSSSGDGGYNEVINGVLGADGTAATAVLPSGNANDHHRAVGSGDLMGHILKAEIRSIDVINVQTEVKGRPWQRYAHSYVGFGLTPKIGRVLTIERPNFLTEKWYVLRHLLTFRRVSITVEGKKKNINSLVISTINSMSKIVKLDDKSSVQDGQMEVYETGYQSFTKLLYVLLKASISGLIRTEKTSKYELTTIRPTLIQLDGEVFTVDGKSAVVITCKKRLLRTVV